VSEKKIWESFKKWASHALSQKARNGQEVGEKRERFRCFTCSTPLVGVLPSKLPAIAGGMGKQPDGCNNEPPGSASRTLLGSSRKPRLE